MELASWTGGRWLGLAVTEPLYSRDRRSFVFHPARSKQSRLNQTRSGTPYGTIRLIEWDSPFDQMLLMVLWS